MGVTDKPILDALKFVAEFVNAVTPEMTREDWRAYLKRHIAAQRKKGVRYTLGPLAKWGNEGRLQSAVSLQQAKQVRQFVVSDLRYLRFDRDGIWTPGDPHPKPKSPFKQTGEHPLGPLLLRLSETFKAGMWRCVALGTAPPEPGQAVCRLKRKHGRIERWAASFSPFGNPGTLQEWVYTMIGKALLSGLLGQFRLCPVCARYFVASGKAVKRINCSYGCKEKASGGTNRVRAWRQTNRELQLGKAEKMKREGKSREEIQADTKLPSRVLQKLFGDTVESVRA